MTQGSVVAPLVLTALLRMSLAAQGAQPAFEVASVRSLGAAWRPPAASPRSDPGRFSVASATLRLLVMRAYNVEDYQIDGPPWIGSEFYDVEAKIPEGASPAQIPEMLQRLLAERFGMRTHLESQVQPVYALVVGKAGPRLKKSDETIPLTDPKGNHASGRIVFSPSGFQLSRATMGKFARALSLSLDRPVIDMTDLPGNFDIVVSAQPDDLQGLQKMFLGTTAPLGISVSSSVFSAVQDLGLKLESRKAPIEHVVIDHVERVPTEN